MKVNADYNCQASYSILFYFYVDDGATTKHQECSSLLNDINSDVTNDK